MKKVLIIEDSKVLQASWKYDLEDMGMEVIQAFTLEEARAKTAEELHDISLIVMDACLTPDMGAETLELTAEIRKEFAGPIMANSSREENQKLLLEAGCDCIGDKSMDLPYEIQKILAS